MNRKIPRDLPQNATQRDKEMKSMCEKERNTIKDRMCVCVCVCVCSVTLSRLTVSAWTVAHQAPLSMGISRQDY